MSGIDWGNAPSWASVVVAMVALGVSIAAYRNSKNSAKVAEAAQVLIWREPNGSHSEKVTISNRTARVLRLPTVVVTPAQLVKRREEWIALGNILEPGEKAEYEFDNQESNVGLVMFSDMDGVAWARSLVSGDLVRIGRFARLSGGTAWARAFYFVTGIPKARRLHKLAGENFGVHAGYKRF